MSENEKRPNKKPEKNTVISQMVGASSSGTQKRGRNGSKQQSIYLTDEHIKAVGLRATFEGVSKSVIVQKLIEKELKEEIKLVREKTALFK